MKSIFNAVTRTLNHPYPYFATLYNQVTMGIKNFIKLIEPFYTPSKVADYYDCILVDAQSFIYEAINYSLMPLNSDEFLNDICKIVTKELFNTLDHILAPSRPESVLIVISFDGEGVPMKFSTQRERREKSNYTKKDEYRFALFGNNKISKLVQSHLMDSLETWYKFATVKFIVSGCNVFGEGEHKIYNIAEKFSCKHPIIVSVDHDVFVISMLRLERYETLQVYRYKKFYNLSKFIKDALPYTMQKLIVVSYLFGNDFIPSLLEISSSNAAKIHTVLTNLKDSLTPPEIINKFLSEMLDCMVFTKVPTVDDSIVIQFWITFFWIIDYYRFPKFPQKYLNNFIFDSFNRNMLLTALLNEEYSKSMYLKAENVYKNLRVSRPSGSATAIVFSNELRQKLSSFWFTNKSSDEGICYEINVIRKSKLPSKKSPI